MVKITGQSQQTPFGCTLCEGRGYRFGIEGKKRVAGIYPQICECTAKLCETCTGDKVAPWLYFSEKENLLKACACRPARLNLEKTRNLFEKSNIPGIFKYRRINEFKTSGNDEKTMLNLSGILEWSYEFIDKFQNKNDRPSKGLFFYGVPGSGKSFLASLILNEIIWRHLIPVKYIKITRDFFNPIRATFNAESGQYGRGEDVFRALAETEVLVIDDFGVQADSPWEQRMLYDLIDLRYEEMKPTIITTNLKLDEITDLFRGRIFSRLKEMTNILEFTVGDYRNNFVD